MERVFRFLTKELVSLHQAAFLLAFTSLLSQLLGLARDRLLAATFGAGSALDIYYTAFRIPDLIYVTIASFVSVTVLIPFITKESLHHSRSELNKFLSAIFTVFSVVMIIALGIVWCLMPILSKWLAPGFAPEASAELISFSRILLLSPLLLGVSNLLGGITQSFHKFFAFTVSPIIYNLGIIVGIVVFYPIFGLVGIVWGVVIGAVLHLLIQLPGIMELGLLPRPTLDIPWRSIKSIIFTSLPRTLTLATYQISMAALVAMGTLIVSGAVAVFSLAQNLQTVPLMIVGVSYSVAAFPTLTKLFSAGDKKAFVDKMVVAAKHITFWSMPAIVFIIVLRAHIVRVILGGGNFSWTDTRLTAAALALFVLSASAQSLVQLFVRGYYASCNTKKPLIINLISAGVIILSGAGLVMLFKNHSGLLILIEKMLRVSDVTGSLILALPLAYSIGTILNAVLFIIVFEKDFGGLVKPLLITTLETTAASILGGAITYAVLLFGAPLFTLQTLVGVLTQAVVAGGVGIIVWLLTLYLLQNQEFIDTVASLQVRFKPKEAMVAEQVEL